MVIADDCRSPSVGSTFVLVRYRYRVCPAPGQRVALARVFGCAQLLRLIGEKAQQYGRTFRQVGRFTPTTQTCSDCGAKDSSKPLHVRTWQCGAVHDRDVNAARNILAAGRAERLNACGGDLRPLPAVAVPAEAGTHRGAA